MVPASPEPNASPTAADAATDPWLHDAAGVAASLGTDLAAGLSHDEAAARRVRFGPNLLDAAPPVPLWRKVLKQFADPLIYLLLGAVVISIAAWLFEGAEGIPYDAIVILVIVIANGILGYVQESKAEAAVAELQRMAAPTARVIRGGVETSVPAEDLVPGDVLALSEGDSVGADGRLVESASLSVAESSLTGESEPVLKETTTLPDQVALGDRVNMVFNGTAVTRGRGRAVVTATGMRTEMGRIATLLGTAEEERTPLQREIDRVGRMLGVIVIVVAVVVVAAVLLTSDVTEVDDVVQVLLLGVSLAVAAVPEGLPAILSVVLAIGVQRMAKRNAIVKQLASVETLGSASVICSDKTGTLTRNQMTIERVRTASGEAVVTGTGYVPIGELVVDGAPLTESPLQEEAFAVLGGGSLANDAVLREEDGDWVIEGDPTEAAFLVAERKAGITDTRRKRFHRVGEVPFTSERKLMSSVEADAAFGGELAVV
ncbi:MAG: cation-translocating P-type ATPase, partial [Jiangellaceae bacterium]